MEDETKDLDIETEVETEEEDENTQTEDETTDNDELNYKQLYLKEKEQREKAESLIVKKKKQDKENKKPVTQATGTMTQKDFLKFNGTSDDELEQIEKIAKVEGVDLITAQKSSLFTAWKEVQEKEVTAKQASLKPSNKGVQLKKNLDQKKSDFGKRDDTELDDALELIKEAEGIK